MDYDPTQIKPVPIQNTLLLINQFVVQTTAFLNSFANTVETKICKVSSRVTELEILMSVFEAKLNSIAGMPEFDAAALPETGAAPAPPAPAAPPAPGGGPAPPPPAGGPTPPAPAAVEPEAPAAAAGPMVKDHPDYAPFFKMLKVGVPMPVVGNKMSAAGLDPELLNTPEAPAPAGGGVGGGDEGDLD